MSRLVLGSGEALRDAVMRIGPENTSAADVMAQLPFLAWCVGFGANASIDSGVVTNFPLTSGFASHPEMYPPGSDAFFYPWPGMYVTLVYATWAASAVGSRRLYINQVAPSLVQQIWSGPAVSGASTQEVAVTHWGVSSGFEGTPMRPGVRQDSGGPLAVSNVRIFNVLVGEL